MIAQFQQIILGILVILLVISLMMLSSQNFEHEPKWSFEESPYIVVTSAGLIRSHILGSSFREKPNIDGVWVPKSKDIQNLENMLPQLNAIEFDSLNGPASLALPVDQYYRVYMGVIIDSKKMIYINAMSYDETGGLNVDYSRDATKVSGFGRVHCGNYCWGGIYDPYRKVFEDLRVDID